MPARASRFKLRRACKHPNASPGLGALSNRGLIQVVKSGLNILKNYGIIPFFSFIVLVLFLIGCSQNQGSTEQDEITASVIEEPSENCRLSDSSDCRPIEIVRVEPTEEEELYKEIPIAESVNITDKPEENITMQNITNLALACEAGWKCIEGKYIAYQEGNCSWHSLERCIYGCNESTCRSAPICKSNSLKCEDDDLMICGEDGYKWLLNESCENGCQNNACISNIPLNLTSNNTLDNATNETIQNDFIADNCISVLKYNLTGSNITDEYFTLKNLCSYQIDMSGWTASDDADHVYTFPSFNLASNGEVTIVTGSGINSQTTLYWGRGSAVWNNGGDTLYLNSSNGTSVLIKVLNP